MEHGSGEGARAAEIEVLRQEARQGDAEAMFKLGCRLLLGRDAPFSPQEGLALIGDAAQRDHAAATAQMATMKAAGAWMPQSWPEALDLLLRAAELGSTRARGQLELLAGDRALAQALRSGANADPQIWRRLRESIDVADWRQPSARQSLCEAPRIRFSPSFLRPDLCRWLVDQARGKLKPALMFDGQRPVFAATRNNSDFCFDIVAADLVILLVREKVSALVKLPIVAMEPPQIFHYSEGQEIKAHYDHVGSEGGYAAERIATLLLYLNDDYEGGELEFPKAGVKLRGKCGDAVYFANVDTRNQPDLLSLHAALPVSRGEKWILSQWIQDRTFGSAATGA